METTFGAVEMVEVMAKIRDYNFRVVVMADVGMGKASKLHKEGRQKSDDHVNNIIFRGSNHVHNELSVKRHVMLQP